MAVLCPGIYNNLTIQKKVIETVVLSLGADVWRAIDKDRSVTLLPHLLLAKDKVLPCADVNTIHNWFNHYAKYGEVPAAT